MLPKSQGGSSRRRRPAWELQLEAMTRRAFWELGRGERPRCAWILVIIAVVFMGCLVVVQLGKYQQLKGLATQLLQKGPAAEPSQQAAIDLVLDSFRRVSRDHAQQLKHLSSELDFLNDLSGLCDTALAPRPPSPDPPPPPDGPKEGAELLCRARAPRPISKQTSRRHTHRMALVIPFRERQKHLDTLLPVISEYLLAQGREFEIFIIEQSAEHRFNRGALLNAAALLLQDSEHDYFVFHDVDTQPTKEGNIQYNFPTGPAPYHITPPELHPNALPDDFFGGVTAFTREQLEDCNGYSSLFWGWGGEDANMAERLKRVGRWPPERPDVPQKDRRFYFVHAPHQKALQVRLRAKANGTQEYVAEPIDNPSEEGAPLSSQVADDFSTGLNSTMFVIKSVQPYKGLAVKYTLDLYCDMSLTPWCNAAEPMPLTNHTAALQYLST